MVVPNKEFITQKLINWTLSDSKRRLEIPIRVVYGTPPQKVKDVLLHEAEKHPEVLDDPPPQTLLLDFGEDALKFELRVFLDFGKGLKTGDELRMAIEQAFKDNDIEFAIPQLGLQLPNQEA